MATKLRNLKVRKVDFVDEGANPDAHIMLYKSRSRAEGDAEGGGGSSGKNEGFWKRFVRAVFRTAGMGQEELDTAMEQIQKSGAASFGENAGNNYICVTVKAGSPFQCVNDHALLYNEYGT